MSNSLPDFLFIGPQKTGTSWIYRYLLLRGDVCLPIGGGETFFFDKNYYRGIKWYNKYFVPSKHHTFLAEVGPTYFQSIQATERIKATLGSIPLICTLRDPAGRAFSHYLHLRRYGLTRLEFRDAVEKHPEILSGSRYATHLKRWYDTFGIENVHIMFQETLALTPEQYALQLCRTVGLMEKPLPDRLKKKVNVATLPVSPLLAFIGYHIANLIRYFEFYGVIEWAKKKGLKHIFFGKPGSIPIPPLQYEDRQWLIELLLRDTEDLEAMLDIDLSHWKLNNTR